MSALDEAITAINRACDCHEDPGARCTVSVRGGDVDRSMFWVLGCDACAELRRKAIATEFGDDVRIVPWPERPTAPKPRGEQPEGPTTCPRCGSNRRDVRDWDERIAPCPDSWHGGQR